MDAFAQDHGFPPRMNPMRLLAILPVLLLVGCATPAVIKEDPVSRSDDPAWVGKTVLISARYGQPGAGELSLDGNASEKPEVAKLDDDVRIQLEAFRKALADTLPAGTQVVTSGDHDYKLEAVLTAYDAEGPAYADYRVGPTVIKRIITAGIGSAEYFITADYSLKLRLLESNGNLLQSRGFQIQERVPHQSDWHDGWSEIDALKLTLFKRSLNRVLTEFNQRQ